MDAHQETQDVDAKPEADAQQSDSTESGSAGNGTPQAIIQVEEIEDFGAVLASWESGLKAVKEGEVVRGKVLKVLEKEVIVDIGYKSEGVIDLAEFRGAKIEVGDQVDVLLEKTEGGDGYVVLSKEKAERLKIWDTVEQAYETGSAA